MTTLRLRPWQRAALDRFVAADRPDFLAVATPGAGKTTFALTCARWFLAERRAPLVVVAPTAHLKQQWSLAAHRLGLQLDPDWSLATGLAPDLHGIVTTYQQVAIGEAATALRTLTRDGFVVLDEIHHAGDERAWGDGVRQAFELAARRLCLSGTPFRSDTSAIPFVRYEDDQARADFEYGYGDALRDGGVVRPVYFPRIDGLMEWTAPEGTVMAATFDDLLDRTGATQRLRTALSLEGDWLLAVLDQAHRRLVTMRSDHPSAGGLVIATDQDHARGVARLLTHRIGTSAEVVVSDDPEASTKIERFAAGDAPWLVAVRMVSEGVDIPRLRVGVYATTVSTELFFRQAVGRFVRWQAGRASQKAYLYIPDDVRLRTHAFGIAEARRHVLRPPTTTPEEELAAAAALDEAQRERAEEQPEQLSLFSVLSAVATSVTVHAAAFDDEPDVPEPEGLDGFAVDLPEVPTAAGFAPPGSLPVARRRTDLRNANATLALRIADLSGLGHARVNAELNKRAGVTSVHDAPLPLLERRRKKAEEWLASLRSRLVRSVPARGGRTAG
jgi:superfamily II DNA or RNA helicase